MDGVAEQGHRPGHGDDAGLDGRGQAQDAQGQPQRAHALAGGLHRRVDLVGRRVAVRGERVRERGEPAAQPRPERPVVVLVVVAHSALAFDEDGREGWTQAPTHPPIVCV